MKNDLINALQQQLLTGRLSRRQFIMNAVAAGIALPSALGMAGNALAMTPKSGGRLRHGTGYGSTTDSLDPGTYENSMMTGVGYAYGNHLTEVDSNGQLIPELAESFEPSADAKPWVFNLRKGVEFHNGKSLTADDVIATFNYHRGEDSKSAAKGLLTAITDIKKDGDDKVIFELENGNADFPYIVSDYHIVILPSSDGKVDATAGVGTGAYILENFEPGVRALFSRNPNYFKSGRGHFDHRQR